MQTEIKKLTILFLLIFPLIHNYGQEDLYSMKLGASAGFLNLDKSYSFNDALRPSDFGLELGKGISPAFAVSAGYIYNTDINSRIYSSLLFHSDNGWLLSKRSVIAPIGGIGLHYYPDEKDKLFMAGEAGLKLRFSDRLSSNITFLTYFKASDIKTFDFSDMQNQTIKLSLNYHFGKKKSDYNSPVFYAGTFLGQQDDSITSSLYTSLFADEENQETKTDSLLRDVPVVIDTLNQTGRNETYQADTLQALVLDSLSTSDVKPDTLENIMLSVEPPDSLKSQEAEIKTDSVSSQAYIAIDTIPSEPDTIIIEYPDSLTEILYKDSAVEKPVLENYSDKIIVNNIFNLSFSDSTISIELSNGQDLIIMHQPQHVFMDKPVSAPNPQTISVPASRNPDSLQNITNLVQTYPVPLPPAQNQMGDRTGTTQEIGIQPMHSYGKGPDSLLLEQNRLLFEILAKLSLSATPSNSQFESEPVNQVLPEIQIVQKDSITKTDTIIKTGSIVVNADSIITKEPSPEIISPEIQAGVNQKIEVLEKQLKLLRGNIEELSVKLNNLEVQDSIKAIIVPEAAVKEQELEPSFIGKYPMTFYFETGEFEMKAAFTPFLKTLVMDANANPEYHILISGYADRYGNPEFNKSLSVQRAESFKKALISYGINVESIIVTGLGSQDASAKTDPQLDRRVEIEIFRLER